MILTLLKKGDPIALNWRSINRVAEQLNKDALPNHDNRAGIAALRQRPHDLTAEPLRPVQGSTWLKWLITTGYVITTSDPIVPVNVETEFTLTSGVARYWFYIDFNATPTVMTSASTRDWSAVEVPIGWVDTATYAADEVAIPTKFRGIFNPCV